MKFSLSDIIIKIIELHTMYANRGPGRVKLIKLLFLIDHEAKKRNLGKITGLEWIMNFFGPFNPKIYEVLRNLMNKGVIDIDVHVYDDLRTEFVYCIRKSMRVCIPKEVETLIEHIVEKYAKKSLYEILWDIYKEIRSRDLDEALLKKEPKFDTREYLLDLAEILDTIPAKYDVLKLASHAIRVVLYYGLEKNSEAILRITYLILYLITTHSVLEKLPREEAEEIYEKIILPAYERDLSTILQLAND